MQIDKEVYQEYEFSSVLWKDKGPAAWYFSKLPKILSKKIRKLHEENEEGWGRLKSKVTIENVSWNTAIWFDTKADCYLLPIKSEIRKKLGLTDGSKIKAVVALESNSD